MVSYIIVICDPNTFEAGDKLDKASFPPLWKRIGISVIKLQVYQLPLRKIFLCNICEEIIVTLWRK
jgi:hypothetical protein